MNPLSIQPVARNRVARASTSCPYEGFQQKKALHPTLRLSNRATRGSLAALNELVSMPETVYFIPSSTPDLI